MDKNRWLLLVNFAIAFYNVGTIWLVQTTCYPLWAFVGPAEFQAYHEAWWHSIWGVILEPGGVGFTGAVAMLWWRPPRVSLRAVWVGVLLQVAVYLLTAVWWAPLMARLAQAVDPSGVQTADFRLLLSTHWLRVALFTAYGLLMFGMARVSFGPGEREAITGSERLQPSAMPTPAGS
jgi:hypothetical protein